MFFKTWRSSVLVFGDTAVLLASVAAGTYFRLGPYTWTVLSSPEGMLKVLLIVGVCQLCLHYSDLNDLRGIVDLIDLMVRLLRALGVSALILAFAYFWFPDWIIGRGVFLLAALLGLSSVVLWRLAFAWLTKRVSPTERLLLVGTGPAAIELARELHERRQELGVEIVGFVDPDPARVGMPLLNPGIVGTIDDIPALLSRFAADRVVVSLADARGKLPMEKLLDSRIRSGVSFDHLASVYEEYTGKIAVENLRPSWMIFAEGFSKSRALRAGKRLFDVLSAIIGLTLAAPIMAIVALVTRLSSPGPILYHQERVGLNGKTFMVHKFRTMREDAEVATGPVWSTANDPRITRVGTFLRRTRLDEIPQLWNVLKGEMSLVGPRPERPSFVSQLTESIPFYGQRHVVKPGLTGWAQVRYTYGASVEDSVQKLQYDLYYVKNMSIALDIVIALETIKTVVLRRGAPVSDPAAVVNGMSIDVEDYFQVSAFDRIVARSDWPRLESRVVANTEALLELFAAAGVRGTFFFLGWVAETFPALARRVAAAGHEIASHGYNHQLVYSLSPDAFRTDVRSAKHLLEDITGQRVRGYRAPSFSVTKKSLWALDVLIEEGYEYDTSIFPVHHDRYGIADAPRHAHVITRPGGTIVEMPGSTVRLGKVNVPVAGGGYFRLLPYAWTRSGIARVNRSEGRPVVFYLHPWEIDPAQPRFDVPTATRIRHYTGLSSTRQRLVRLLEQFRFDTVASVLAREGLSSAVAA